MALGLSTDLFATGSFVSKMLRLRQRISKWWHELFMTWDQIGEPERLRRANRLDKQRTFGMMLGLSILAGLAIPNHGNWGPFGTTGAFLVVYFVVRAVRKRRAK